MNKEIEKAIEKLKWVMEEPNHRILSDESVKTIYQLSITALEAQQADMWIPISSGRLPEIPLNWINDGFNRVAVLATSDGEDMPVTRWYDIEDKLFFKDYDSLASADYSVRAWKPLDEPWKEVHP